MSFHLRFPDKIVYGCGTFRQVGVLCAGLGKHPVIVTGRKALKASGRLDQAKKFLVENGLCAEVFDGVDREPCLNTCQRGIEFARGHQCDSVLAIGGGSALDVGKAIAAIAPQRGPRIHTYFSVETTIAAPPLPLVAVPTTAGTGSECTNNAVLTDTKHGVKKSLRDERMVPSVALVDPELTVGAPADVTAQSGMDALTQAIEAYVSRGSNPVTDALALRAIELIHANLRSAVAHGEDIRFREPVALGSLMTGMAFANAGLGAVHGLAHPIGVGFDIPHGLVCAVLLPHVCEFNLPVHGDKFAHIASLLGVREAADVPTALMKMNRQVGIPDTLRAYGFAARAFPKVLADCRSGSMSKNPREASDVDLLNILEKII